MCGRYSLTTKADLLAHRFRISSVPPDLRPRFNIAPGQDVPVITNGTERKLELFRWGLVPSWAKDPRIGYRLINARAETLANRSSFCDSFRKRRCLVLADGFFEWKNESGVKTPIYIRLRSGEPFAFAGLWDCWQPPNSAEIRTCTIITTEPNELVASIHDRMPLILLPVNHDAWLDPNRSEPRELRRLFQPFPHEWMEAYPVSRLVNHPENDCPECIRPAYSPPQIP